MSHYLRELPSFLMRKIKSRKISHSLTGIDLIIDYIFKNKKGIYVDIGCNHPVFNNNTFILYEKGWRGINIDIDKKSIDLFNLFRKGDINLNLAVSEKNSELEFINFHDKSPINRIKRHNEDIKNLKFKEIKKIKSSSLNSILENSKYKDQQIDFVSIDVEGHELDLLKGFDLKKYKPSVIVIEYLDLKIKKLEIKNFEIQNILNSEVYMIMEKNGYNLVNWVHSDLIFIHDSFKNKEV